MVSEPCGHRPARPQIREQKKPASARTSSRFRRDMYLLKRYRFNLRGDEKSALVVALSLTRGSWSRKHESCQQCGTIERPHQGNGLCARRYTRADGRRDTNTPT